MDQAGRHPMMEFQLGPVRHTIGAKSQAARRCFDHRLFVRETDWRLDEDVEPPKIQDIYRCLAADESRNRIIVDDVLHALEQGRSPIVLTERRDHLDYHSGSCGRPQSVQEHCSSAGGFVCVESIRGRFGAAPHPLHYRAFRLDPL